MDEQDNVIEVSIASAREDERIKVAQFDRMKEQSAKYGLIVTTNVPYDGNCFFHSISHHTKLRADWLRRDLVAFMKTKVKISILLTEL